MERAARREAEQGRANEALLRQQAEARAAIGQAAALLGENRFSAADQLLTRVNFPESGLGGEAVFRPLGDWAAAEGLWLRAAEYFKLLLRVDQMETPDVATLDSTRCAVALIKAGDEPGYDQFRRDVIERFGGTPYPVEAERTLKNSLLLPADKTIMAALAPLADLAIKAVPVGTPTAGGGAVAGRYRLALCFPGSVELSSGRLRRNRSLVPAMSGLRKWRSCPSRHCQRHPGHVLLPARSSAGRERCVEPQPQSRSRNGAQGQWFDWALARILMNEAAAVQEDPIRLRNNARRCCGTPRRAKSSPKRCRWLTRIRWRKPINS